MADPVTPIRLSPSDRVDVEAIRQHYNLPTIAAAIRFAVKDVRRRIAKETRRKGDPAA